MKPIELAEAAKKIVTQAEQYRKGLARLGRWYQDTVRFLIHTEYLLYQRDKNPLRALWAWQRARKSGIDMPQWVEEYIDTLANNLLNIDSRGRSDRSVKKALGVSDNHFAELKNSQREAAVAQLVWNELDHDRPKYDPVFEVVAKNVSKDWGEPISKSTVRAYYQKYESVLKAYYQQYK